MKKNNGFTIIELLVMISAFVIVSLIAFSFLSMTLLSSSKAIATKEVRQNGNYALSVIERLVISAKSVTCPTQQSIEITTLDDNSTIIDCSTSRIASGSADPQTLYLTNDKVSVSYCRFDCVLGEGVPGTVDVKFTLGIGNEGSPAHERSSMVFENKFVVRNQRN